MATSDKNTGTSGKLRINYTVTQSTSADTSSISFSFQIVNSSSQTFTNGTGWSANAAGVANSGSFSINGAQTVTLWSSSRGPFNHDSNGNASAQTFSMHMNYTGTSGLGGPTDHSVSVSLPRIPEAPGAPGTPTVDTVTDTSVILDWTAAARGHANINNYGLYVATDSGFVNHVYQAWVGVVLTKELTGLNPGTTYYARVRAQNADGIGAYSGTRSFLTAPGAPTGLAASSLTPSGFSVAWSPVTSATGYELQYSTSSSFSGATTVDPAVSPEPLSGLLPGTPYYVRVRAKNASGSGAWSATLQATTLPATAPGITVTPGVTGTTASIGLTPPSGATGVTKYTVRRRTTGTTTPVTSVDTTTSPLSVSGLTPGTSYQWSATAWFGTYESPASAWVTAVQPKPNTSPGDYFDGATTDIADPNAGEPPLVDYGWTSTANGSTSTAKSPGVDGWNSPHAGTALHRVLGGRSGKYAARMLALTAEPAAGQFNTGQTTGASGRSEVEGNTPYVGSLYVKPSRPQRLVAYLIWYNAAGAEVGTRSLGAETNVTDLAGWTRLIATGTSPSDAATAIVRTRTVAGTGYTPFLSGEYLDADDAMITLSPLVEFFYGDTPDTADALFAWLGPVNASVSTRTPLENVEYDPLADPDCDPLPLPPTPPVVLDDCIIEVGTWRRYWVAVPASEVNLWLSTIPTIHLRSGRGEDDPALPPNGVRQVRIRVWANPDDLDPSVFDPSEGWEAEQIVSYMPPFSILTLDGVNERAWAQVGSETVDPATVEPIGADRLLYGTNGAPATWPVLSCGIAYLISLDVPLDAPVGNLTATLDLTKRML